MMRINIYGTTHLTRHFHELAANQRTLHEVMRQWDFWANFHQPQPLTIR